MFEILFGAIIVAIIIFSRMIVFGKSTWRSSLLYTVSFIVIYVIIQFDLKYGLDIRPFSIKLLIIGWVIMVIVVELWDRIKALYSKLFNKKHGKHK